LLIDDGSANDAWATISKLTHENPKVKGLQLARNFGQQVAITAGLDQADGNWVVVMDADLQDRPEAIPELHAKALEGYDVVFVDRAERPEPMLYRAVTALFYLLLNMLSGQDYNRLQGNFSIASAKVVRAFRRVREPGRFYGGILRWVGFKHTSISSIHAPADFGQTSYTLSKRARFAFTIIISFSTRLLYLSIIVGLLMAIGGFAAAVFIVIEKLMYPDYPLQGWPSLMSVVFFTAGVTNVAIGLMGIYVGQIVAQTKGRPLYVVTESTFELKSPAFQ
jgi:dolichol-phosphate mannosyltransferase